MIFRRLAVLVGGPILLLLCIAPVRAQDAVSSQTYGTGVHAYFAGDYRRAYELLTSAIGPNSTSRDPRMYYFCALTFLRLGRDDEAKQDFQQGAKLEMTNTDQTYNISRALERVQGAERQHLEQYRVTARIVAQQQSEEQNRARYEQQKREESRVLLNQSQPSSAVPGPAAPPPDVPFGEGSGKVPARETAAPAKEAAAPTKEVAAPTKQTAPVPGPKPGSAAGNPLKVDSGAGPGQRGRRSVCRGRDESRGPRKSRPRQPKRTPSPAMPGPA